MDKLTVRILTNYTIQQRNQQNIKTGMKFIDEAFDYLEKEVPNLTNAKICDVLSSFLGESYQLPPMFSAVKKDGKGRRMG